MARKKQGMLGRWGRKVRRRRPGIYLVRTDRHRRRGRENGYVGLSNNLELRRLQHLGLRGTAPAKPWSDLDPVWHYLRLPWWLGWRWVLAPLEAFAIWLLAPRYNQTMNKANPRRVPLGQQAVQRQQRDRDRARGRILSRDRASAAGRVVVQIFGVVLILAGAIMTYVTR